MRLERERDIIFFRGFDKLKKPFGQPFERVVLAHIVRTVAVAEVDYRYIRGSGPFDRALDRINAAVGGGYQRALRRPERGHAEKAVSFCHIGEPDRIVSVDDDVHTPWVRRLCLKVAVSGGVYRVEHALELILAEHDAAAADFEISGHMYTS